MDAEGSSWWDRFYADRERGIPFFVDKPDESLATWLDRDRPAYDRNALTLTHTVGCSRTRPDMCVATPPCA